MYILRRHLSFDNELDVVGYNVYFNVVLIKDDEVKGVFLLLGQGAMAELPMRNHDRMFKSEW